MSQDDKRISREADMDMFIRHLASTSERVNETRLRGWFEAMLSSFGKPQLTDEQKRGAFYRFRARKKGDS